MTRIAPRHTNNSPIAAARIRAGMTQAQLAEAVGCRQKDVSLWETSTRSLRATTLMKIARTLGCTMESLLSDDD